MSADPNETNIYPDGLSRSRRWIAIAAISFGTSLLVIDGAIANVALPTIACDLSVSNAAITNVVTVYQAVLVMFILPFSSLGNLIGHRRLYQSGQLLFLAASAICILADSIWLLLIFRTIQALGAAMAMSVASAMLRQIYPKGQLGSGLGFNSVVIASSAAFAPTMGSYIVAHFPWQYVFVAAAPLAIVSLLLGQSLPPPVRGHNKMDWLSSGWSATTLLLLIGGLQTATHGDPFIGSSIVTCGLLSAFGLARREAASRSPVFPIDLLKHSTIGFSALAAMSSFCAVGIVLLSLPFKLELHLGYDPQTIGMLLLPFPLTMIIVSPLAGWLSDRIAATKLGLAGLSAAIFGLAALAFMPDDVAISGIAWRLSLTAAGFGFFLAPNTRLLISRAPLQRAAAAGGLLATSRLMGQTLAAIAVGILLADGLGMGAEPMLLSCLMALIAAFSSVARYTKRKKT